MSVSIRSRPSWLPWGVSLAAAGVLAGVLSCESSPPAGPSAIQKEDLAAPDPYELPLDVLAGERGFADLKALLQRRGEGDATMRRYVTEELADAGLEPENVETPNVVAGGAARRHVVVQEPGASRDLFLLVAPLNAVGDEAALSGPALLLELARVLSTRTLPYTTRLVWLDGADDGAASYAADLVARGELARVRLLVAFERVCTGDLRIARDLISHRVHREEFFDAAARTGHSNIFAREGSFETVEGPHVAFRDAGVRGVVALSAASPAESAPSSAGGCTPPVLAAVGDVSLDALDAIGRRLAKIDRFSRAPIAAVETPVADTTPTPPRAALPEPGPVGAPPP